MNKSNILFISLYSDKYPAIGESHGLSVITGAVASDPMLQDMIDNISVFDMVSYSQNDYNLLVINIRNFEPDIIGIAVNYGTFEHLPELFDVFNKELFVDEKLIIFGGALATYIPEIIINQIYKKGIVVVGEGDVCVPLLVKAWINKGSYNNIENLCFSNNDLIVRTQRKLTKPNDIKIPYRGHIDEISKKGAQIFIESSRGCSWAKCSLCLRGITDIVGEDYEFRRFDISRLLHDLLILKEKNVTALTFADEDFLGGALEDIEKFVFDFVHMVNVNNLEFIFDASLTVHSIYSERFNDAENKKRFDLLNRLRQIGLNKIFLGVESGSPSQLKRYRKGHTVDESIKAIEILRSLGYTVELGFIMFDPLCTLIELEENIDYILSNELAPLISSVTNELRLYNKSAYKHILDDFQKKEKIKLYSECIDYNTASYETKYLIKKVSELVNCVRIWNETFRVVHYPLKNLSRYGEGGIIYSFRKDIIMIVSIMRTEYLQLLKKTVFALKNNILTSFDKNQILKIVSDARFQLDLVLKKHSNVLDNKKISKLVDQNYF